MLKKVFLLCMVLLLGTSCAKEVPNIETRSNMCIDCGFDTFFALQGIVAEEEEFNALFLQASDQFRHYNDLFDIYHTYENINNLKTINDNAGKEPVVVDEVILELLQEAKEFYAISNGRFDVTSGALLAIWHDYRERGIAMNSEGEYGPLPKLEKLQEASTYKGWDYVEIDETNHTVFITDEHVSLDVGGIAKGFATEKVAQMLEEAGWHTGAVNAGGNNRTLGQKADGTAWRVGIQDPSQAGSLLTVSMDGTCSFVTSGDYERYFVAEDEKQYHHIINPETLYPAEYFHSVSVITNNSGVADCLSTTLFTLSYEDGLQLIEAYRKAHPDEILEVVWITDVENSYTTDHQKVIGQQRILYTEGLTNKITWRDPQ